MRDKARIKRILKLIEKLWVTQQDMRLGQLLVNYVFEEDKLWYQEDSLTENILKRMVKINEAKEHVRSL